MISEFGSMLQNRKAPAVNFANFKVTKATAPKKVSQTIKDLQTAWLFMGWQTAGVQNKKDFVTLKVMNTILGSGMSSRLFRNLREADGLAYQLGSNYTPKMLAGSFVAYIGTNPDTLEYSRNKILKEIERFKMEFVSDTELKDAKDRLKGSFVIAMETNSEKASNIGARLQPRPSFYYFKFYPVHPFSKHLETLYDIRTRDESRYSNIQVSFRQKF